MCCVVFNDSRAGNEHKHELSLMNDAFGTFLILRTAPEHEMGCVKDHTNTTSQQQ